VFLSYIIPYDNVIKPVLTKQQRNKQVKLITDMKSFHTSEMINALSHALMRDKPI